MTPFRFLSVCDGIGAAAQAFMPLGWEPLAFSEIDPFARAVISHHHSSVPLHGDFRELIGQPWTVDADLLCGGAPCQDFSIAGLRAGFAGLRGTLTMDFVRLADATDDLRHSAGKTPVWVFFENVPGILSADEGAGFGTFLGALVGSDEPIDPPQDGWPRAGVVAGPRRVAAWRVLDARYFGLAQRRERVFVLALGGAGGWACADALLPIGEGMRRHPAPGRETGQRTARPIAAGSARGSGYRNDADTADNLIAGTLNANGKAAGSATLSSKDHGADATDDLAPTLRAGVHDKSHANAGVPPAVAFALRGREGGAMPEVHEDVSALRATSGGSTRDYVAFDTTQMTSRANRSNPQPGDPCHPLAARAHPPAIAQPAMGVRRLTPRECARLQGFSDDHLGQVTWHGRCPPADGPQYRGFGNSWAVPCVAWIGRRIAASLPQLHPTGD